MEYILLCHFHRDLLSFLIQIPYLGMQTGPTQTGYQQQYQCLHRIIFYLLGIKL